MSPFTFAMLFTISLFIGMFALIEVGRRLGIRRKAKEVEAARAGLGALEGAIFGLMGLLVAFTFSGASSRFDARRQLIVEETNAIGTAYLRLDLLPVDRQPALRELFRTYVQNRIDTYRKLPDIEAAKAELAKTIEIQSSIWTRAVDACREGDYQPAAMLLLPALNQMIDMTTTRAMAAQMHPPTTVFIMLAVAALASALLAGFGMAGGKTRSWIHIIAFVSMMAITVNVIFDIEFPRLGFIRIDSIDQAMVELQQNMKE